MEYLGVFVWLVLYLYFLIKMIKSKYRIWFLFFFFLSFPAFSKFWYQSPYGDASSGYRYYYVKILKKEDCNAFYVYKVKYSYNSSNLQTENGCGLLGGTSISLTDGDENHINDFSYIVSFDNSDEATPQDYCPAYKIDSALCDNHVNFYCQSGDWGGFNIDLALVCNYDEIVGFKLYPIPDLYANVIFSVYGVSCDNYKFVYSVGQTALLVKKLVKKDDTSQIIAWIVQVSGGSITTSDDTASGSSTVFIPDVYFMYVAPAYYDEASNCITVDYYVIDVSSQNIGGSFWAIEKHIKDLTGHYLSSYYLILNGVEAFNLKLDSGIKCFDNENDGSDDDGDVNSDDNSDDDNDPFNDDNNDDNSDDDNNTVVNTQENDYSYDEDAMNDANGKVQEVFDHLGEILGSHFNGLYSLAQTLSQQNPEWVINFSSISSNLTDVNLIDNQKFYDFIQKLRSLLKWVFSYIFLMAFIKRLTPGD